MRPSWSLLWLRSSANFGPDRLASQAFPVVASDSFSLSSSLYDVGTGSMARMHFTHFIIPSAFGGSATVAELAAMRFGEEGEEEPPAAACEATPPIQGTPARRS